MNANKYRTAAQIDSRLDYLDGEIAAWGNVANVIIAGLRSERTVLVKRQMARK